MNERDEDSAIAKVIERIALRFPTLSHDHIEQVVHEEQHQFDASKVRDFVPVIVEHEVMERLRLEADPAPLAPVDDEGTSAAAADERDPLEVERRAQHTGLLIGDAGGGDAAR